MAELREVGRERRPAGGDLFEEPRLEESSRRGIDGHFRDLFPGLMEDHGCGLGVPAHVEFPARGVGVFGGKGVVGGDWIEAAAHEDQFPGQGRKLRVEERGDRQVGQRAGRENGDLPRVHADRASQEARGALALYLDLRRAGR